MNIIEVSICSVSSQIDSSNSKVRTPYHIWNSSRNMNMKYCLKSWPVFKMPQIQMWLSWMGHANALMTLWNAIGMRGLRVFSFSENKSKYLMNKHQMDNNTTLNNCEYYSFTPGCVNYITAYTFNISALYNDIFFYNNVTFTAYLEYYPNCWPIIAIKSVLWKHGSEILKNELVWLHCLQNVCHKR